jgi:hypothetical protein
MVADEQQRQRTQGFVVVIWEVLIYLVVHVMVFELHVDCPIPERKAVRDVPIDDLGLVSVPA